MRTLSLERESRSGREISERWEEVSSQNSVGGSKVVGGALAGAVSGGVGGAAARGRAVGPAGGVEYHPRGHRGRGNAARGPRRCPGGRIAVRALGQQLGHVVFRGQAAAARWATATRGARRHRR